MGLVPKYFVFIWVWIFLAGLCWTASAQTGSAHYDLGVFSYESGDYREAETFLKKALKNRPEDAYTQFYLARTYLSQERFSEAESLFHAAWASDPDIPGLPYEMGILYYKMDLHDRALNAFENVLAENPFHAPALYHAGTSLFMLGRYFEAIDYLERASDTSDSVKQGAYYYVGICHYRLSEYEKALVKFNYVVSAAATTILREDAERWAMITRMHLDREKPWRLYAKVGWQYDDNVQLAPLDSDRFEEESDYAAALFFSGRYVLGAAPQTDIGAGYSHYQTFYRDFDEYNFIGSIGEIFAEHSVDRLILGLFYIPAYYRVDTDSYLMQHQVRPELRWRLAWAGELAFSYSYARNKYFKDTRRDGYAHEINVDYVHGFNAGDGYLFSGAGYNNNSASHKDEYFTEASIHAGISVGFFEQFRIRIQGNYTDKRYDYKDSFFGVKREDDRYGASGAATWTPGAGRFDVSVEYAHTRNESNVNDYDYRRNTLGMFVSAGF